jgi:hypothetical protein
MLTNNEIEAMPLCATSMRMLYDPTTGLVYFDFGARTPKFRRNESGVDEAVMPVEPALIQRIVMSLTDWQLGVAAITRAMLHTKENREESMNQATSEPRSSAKKRDAVPPPVDFTCSYSAAVTALAVVTAADNDKYFAGQEPTYLLRAGTNETTATTSGRFEIDCERRKHPAGGVFSVNAGEVYHRYMTDGQPANAEWIRELLSRFPVVAD